MKIGVESIDLTYLIFQNFNYKNFKKLLDKIKLQVKLFIKMSPRILIVN